MNYSVENVQQQGNLRSWTEHHLCMASLETNQTRLPSEGSAGSPDPNLSGYTILHNRGVTDVRSGDPTGGSKPRSRSNRRIEMSDFARDKMEGVSALHAIGRNKRIAEGRDRD